MKAPLAPLICALIVVGCPVETTAQSLGPGLPAPEQAAFRVEPVIERIVDSLPAGPLYWRVETFPSLAEAERAAGPWGLTAEAFGRAWLFTLGPPGGASEDAVTQTEIGPVQAPRASRYLLRINRASAPPGSATPVHAHPGSEVFHVLRGRLEQTTPHGVVHVDAGGSLAGHEPGMAMQLRSVGTTDLEQLILFLVDADQPFSSPAAFE
jgi:quercetin dioxygenase-like cupin family protein